ncbi:hypothetical protein Tco_1292912 [Tanacetum coccineum]
MFSRETIEGAQGYKVKKIYEAILEAILKKHGALEATCVFSDAALRTSLLYVMNNRRENHPRAYLSLVEDCKARNVLPRNHRGCSGLEGRRREKADVAPENVGRDHYPLWAALLMNNIREHHTRAYLSPVEDSRARNVSPRNHRGCSRLEETNEGAQGYKVKDANKAILEAILKKDDGLEATCLFSDAALRTSLLYVDAALRTTFNGRCLRNEREHHTRAYLSLVEDSRARNVSRETIEGAQG